jgi:hypothetical protein
VARRGDATLGAMPFRLEFAPAARVHLKHLRPPDRASVDAEARVVLIIAIGVKSGNILHIGGNVIEL